MASAGSSHIHPMAKKKQRPDKPPGSPHPSVAQRLAQACALHQSGQLAQAEIHYRAILQRHPNHAETLLLLAHLCTNSSASPDAADIIRRAVKANPGHPVAHVNLGVLLLGERQHEAAIASFDRAIALLPNYADAFCNRGLALQNLDRHADALTSFEQALALDPRHAAACSNRGVSLQALGRHEEALRAFDLALELQPQQPEIHNNRGVSALALHRYAQASADFEQALQAMPATVEVQVNYALTLQHLGRDAQAVVQFEQVLTREPTHPKALRQRGLSLLKLGRDAAALASLDQAIGATPGTVQSLNQRGRAFQEAGRLHDALACFDQSLDLDPDNADSHTSRANVLRALNRPQDALASYESAVRIDPGSALAHFNLSLCQLLLGDFAQGWQQFEWRWQIDLYKKAQRQFAQPLWLGQTPVSGQTILLHAEQGLGDTIQFCRYASVLDRLGARVLLLVPATLRPVLQGLPGVAQCLAIGEALPAFDLHCPLMSLPLALATDLARIPASPAYLHADPERLARWQARLGARTRPRVGLAWSGNPDFGNDASRSIALARLLPLLSDRVQFVSLQKDVRECDLGLLQQHPELLQFGPELEDFADTAALIMQLDLVICVDTAVAHLAGALGKPVWILLPCNPDWRWLLQRSDSPWYPSARLWRQARPNDWDSLITQVKTGLQNQIGCTQTPPDPPQVSVADR